MSVYTIDPVRDPRWADLVDRHPSSSVFHSLPWLETIQRTYGYRPVVYTTSPPSAPLTNGILFSEIHSWLTGNRLVSLPFSDHCEPLLDNANTATEIAVEIKKTVDSRKWKYVEIRPLSGMTEELAGAFKAPPCYLHMLDMRPSTDDLFRATHKNCIQRTIKRAENQGIGYESGNSERLLKAFYRLMIQTRRRHQLPPQPFEWFRNLAACMGDRLKIRVAFKDQTEIASILTLLHKNIVVYKYGCSDSSFNNLGGTPFLFWKAITESKVAGMTSMDFGRSDSDNPGLITFKDRWGTKSSELTYLRWSLKPVSESDKGALGGAVKRVFAMMPDAVLETTGRILYRHVG